MITLLIPGFGILIWLALAVFVGVVARREGFPLWAAVLLGIFTEIGIVAVAVTWAVEALGGKGKA